MPSAKPPPPNKLALGLAIKSAREAFPMTQLALAHKIGLKGDDAGAYISRVEGGQEPRMQKLMLIAKALGVTLESLFSQPV